MVDRNVGKIEIEIDVVGIRHNGLAKKSNCLGSISIRFVGGGCQVKHIGIRRFLLQQRLQCGNRILGMLRHHLN